MNGSSYEIDISNELDFEWINDLNMSINNYKDFYKEPCNLVFIYYLFVSKSNELVLMKKEKVKLQENVYRSELLSSDIKNKPRNYQLDNYRLLTIAKFNIDVDPQEIINYSFFKNTEPSNKSSYFKTYDTIQDIHFNDTISFLQKINTLFIIFKEINKSALKSSNKSSTKTKRVSFSLSKHSKTRKITV